MKPIDAVSAEDIARLIDGELTESQRTEMHTHLAANPRLAAEVFAEVERMNAVRAAQPHRLFSPRATVEGARKLENAFRRQAWLRLLRMQVAAALLVALGWGAHSLTEPLRQGGKTVDDEFILAARESLRVAQLNVGIRHGMEPKAEKIERLVGTLNIGVPQLPSTWQVTDVQVQPWDGKQSLVITATTPALGQVTLVAAPMSGEDAVPPTSATDGRVPTVYWQSGGTAYALMGPAAPERLEREAAGIEVATRKGTGPKRRG